MEDRALRTPFGPPHFPREITRRAEAHIAGHLTHLLLLLHLLRIEDGLETLLV